MNIVRRALAAQWLHDQFSKKCTNPDDCCCQASDMVEWNELATDLVTWIDNPI